MITPETKMKLDREFVVRVWHVVVYNIGLIVAGAALFVRLQVTVENQAKLSEKIEARVAAVEKDVRLMETKLPAIETTLRHISETLQEIKVELRRR